MRVLITRPAGDAQAAAADIRARGHEVLACPLINVEDAPAQSVSLAATQGFIVTDADGARALAKAVGVRTFPVFCESAGTASTLTALGFQDARSAHGDAPAIARLVEHSLNPKLGGLVYVCSTSAPINLSAMLGNAGFAARMTPLYAISRVEVLPQKIADALKTNALDCAVFFSADEARAFALLVQRANLDATTARLVAIVAAPVVAAPLTVLKFARIVTAVKSDAGSVIATVSDDVLPQPEPVAPEPEPEPEPEIIIAPPPEPLPLEEPIIESRPEGPTEEPTPDIVPARVEEDTQPPIEEQPAAKAVGLFANLGALFRRAPKIETVIEPAAIEPVAQEESALPEPAPEILEIAEIPEALEVTLAPEPEPVQIEEQVAEEPPEQPTPEPEPTFVEEPLATKSDGLLTRLSSLFRRAPHEEPINVEQPSQAENVVEIESASPTPEQPAQIYEPVVETPTQIELVSEPAPEPLVVEAPAEIVEEVLAHVEGTIVAPQTKLGLLASIRGLFKGRDAASQEATTQNVEQPFESEPEVDSPQETDLHAPEPIAMPAPAPEPVVEPPVEEPVAQFTLPEVEELRPTRITIRERLRHVFAGKSTPEETQPELEPEPELATEPIPESPPEIPPLKEKMSVEKSPQKESLVATIPPIEKDDFAPAMETPLNEPKTSESETPRTTRGTGRAARLLAEDAADARAIHQRIKMPGGEPEPDYAEPSTNAAAAGLRNDDERAPRSSSGLPKTIALLIGLVVIAGVIIFSAPRWVPLVRGTMQAKAPVEQLPVAPTPTPSTAQSASAQPDSTKDIAALNARLTLLEQRPTTDNVGALEKRVAALETTAKSSTPDALADSVTNQARQLTTTMARIATLESAIGNVAKLEDLAKRLSALEGKSAEANSVLALSERVSGLEKRDSAAATALVIATAQLHEAVRAGRIYAVELEAVNQLAARAGVIFDATALSGTAAKGLVRADALKETFPGMAGAVMRSNVVPGDMGGWLSRMLDRALSVMSIRPFGNIEGTTPGAVLARAEQALRADNMALAVSEVESLTGAPAAAAAQWLAQAKSYVGADQALNELAARSVGAMSAVSQTKPAATAP